MRKHATLMVEYALDKDSLAFVKTETIGATNYYVYVEYPLWDKDKEYLVRTDFTHEEAVADRQITLLNIEGAKSARYQKIAELEKELAALKDIPF
tara:strand:+ start:36229 stop:36513 length:285 start_codon:yes stop_codon:yes gene_type:complete